MYQNLIIYIMQIIKVFRKNINENDYNVYE